MGLNLKITDWIFVSKAEQRRREAEYQKRLFPIGEAQKQKEREILSQIIHSICDEKELFYHLSTVKEIMSRYEDAERERHLYRWYSGYLAKAMNSQECANIIALAEMEEKYSSLDEYPNVALIEVRGQEILSTTLAGWER